MMIRALLRKQLRELGAAFLRSSKTGKARSRASAVGYALLFAVLVVVLMLCFAGMALPLASVLLPAGLDWLYFASMGLTALLVSVLASAFTSYSGLFQSRDNELLLSLPIPPAVIFGVRVSTVYLACLIYLLMAWVPAVVCYGLLAAHPLAGVLCSIPMALVLAGAACILAVLLGWAVALANDRARHKSLVTVVCSLVFFALYYAGFLRVQEMLDDLLADAAQSGAALCKAAVETGVKIISLPCVCPTAVICESEYPVMTNVVSEFSFKYCSIPPFSKVSNTAFSPWKSRE